MMHRRTVKTTVSAVSKSPPGRPPRSPAAAPRASSTAPAPVPGSRGRITSRSTRAAPLRSSGCAAPIPIATPRRAPPSYITGHKQPPHPPRGVKPNRSPLIEVCGIAGHRVCGSCPLGLATQPAACAWWSPTPT
eukprot:scaffold20089_cov59-Phaeocystis_antarctica.AAC.2